MTRPGQKDGRPDPTGRDMPGRLLDAAVGVMPAGRRDWGRAMQAELAAIADPGDRRSFARGCVRTAAAQFHLVRGAVHLLAVLGTLGTLLAWTATIDFPPLAWVLYAMMSLLAAVCWEARRAGMLGPIDDSVTAWLLRLGGYLIAAGIATVAVLHARPATLKATDAGVGVLVFATIPSAVVIGIVTAFARRSAATARVLVSGVGGGLAALLAWLLLVVITPPIPPSVELALAATGAAAVAAVLANSDRSGTTPGALLAGLLAMSTAMVLIFAGVVVLAHWGPDRLIPHITPHAPPADRIRNSRIEIVDPYVLLLVLSGLAGTALALTAVVTRRSAVVDRPVVGKSVAGKSVAGKSVAGRSGGERLG